MNPDPLLRLRLEALFGKRWQAALDHAGLISRRHARALGAGQEATQPLVAMIELLERLPVAQWPRRWFGLGKASESCPLLTFFADRLIEGRIRPEDAVFAFDRVEIEDRLRFVNAAVGLAPANAFDHLPRDHAWRRAWSVWNNQWDSVHGGGTVHDWMQHPSDTPEGFVAHLIDDGVFETSHIDGLLNMLADRIHDFSPNRVREKAEYLCAAHEDGVEDRWAGYAPGVRYKARRKASRPKQHATPAPATAGGADDEGHRFTILTDYSFPNLDGPPDPEVVAHLASVRARNS